MELKAKRKTVASSKSSDLDRQINEAKIILRQLRDTLEDLDDRCQLARAKQKNEGRSGTDWSKIKKEFGLDF